MSGFHNKNLIFYSTHPNDKYSIECLKLLEGLPELNRQFIRICIHHPDNYNAPPLIKLPNIVTELKNRGYTPIIAMAGFQQPILAQQALSFLSQTALKYGSSVAPSNIHGKGTADNCATVEQSSMANNSLFDTEYNIGFSDARGEFNKGYASIDEAVSARIETFAENTDKESQLKESAKRLEELKQSRGFMSGGGSGMLPPVPGFGNQRASMPSSMPSMPSMPPVPRRY